jgi:predicted negative regulator of RcsB-dependent stress response
MDNLEASFNEHQKIEQIKTWFKKYGNRVWILAVIILAFIIALQYWQRHKMTQSNRASQIYSQLLMSISKTDNANTQAAANELIQHYASTPYAKIAAFGLAQQAVQNHKLDEASIQLQWIVHHTDQPFLSQLAQFLLAQILLSQKQAKAALDTLKGAEKIYPIQTGLIKAQALLSLGDVAQARLSLQKSIDLSSTDTAIRPILEMVLNDLPNK